MKILGERAIFDTFTNRFLKVNLDDLADAITKLNIYLADENSNCISVNEVERQLFGDKAKLQPINNHIGFALDTRFNLVPMNVLGLDMIYLVSDPPRIFID